MLGNARLNSSFFAYMAHFFSGSILFRELEVLNVPFIRYSTEMDLTPVEKSHFAAWFVEYSMPAPTGWLPTFTKKIGSGLHKKLLFGSGVM